jgi:hypothetical protein
MVVSGTYLVALLLNLVVISSTNFPFGELKL